MKLKLITYSVLILLNATGCMKISKKGSERTTTQTTAPEPTPDQNSNQTPVTVNASLKNFYELKTDRFDFVVSSEKIDFHFPETWPLNIYAEVTINQTKMVIPIQNERYWNFKWPSQDHKIRFRFFAQPDLTVKPLKSIDVLPSLSLEVSNSHDLAAEWSLTNEVEKIYFEDLILNRRAKLLLGTFSGQIFVRNLRSDDGSIQSFETNSKAALDQDGRSGGFVEIFVQDGSGSLNLHAVGEHGGDGSPGRNPDEANKGERGADGVRSTFSTEITNCGINPNCMALPITSCLTPPGAGQNGGEGKQGYHGQSGRTGGNSGRYYLGNKVEDLNVTELTRPGRGGNGGRAGAGGEGGDGGDGGDGATLDYLITHLKKSKATALAELKKPQFFHGIFAFGKKCEPAANGIKGPRGPEGYPGSFGIDGANQGQK